MATQLAPLWVRVGADIKGYQAGMAKVQTQAKATGRAVALASKLAAGALIGIGIAALKAGADIQNATALIRRGTGATGEALKGLKKDFDAVFGTVPEDAQKVATAIADLNTRLELTGEPLQRMSKLFLDFARIAGEDVGETIRRTTRVFGDWSVATERQEDVMNLLLRASQNSGVAITELSGKLVQFGAPLRQVGFTLEQSIALLAKWEKEGVNVEAILGSLKISIGKFATAGEDAGTAFKRALSDIASVETEAEAAAIALDTVGSRAMADFAAAVREGRFDIEDFQKALSENTDTVRDAARESETTGDRMAIAWNRALKALAPLGEALLSIVDEVIGWAENIGKLAGEIAKLFEGVGKAAEKWIPQWIKDGSIDKLNAEIGNLIFAITNPKLFKEAQRLARQAHEMAPAMGTWIEQIKALPARLNAAAAAAKKAADEAKKLADEAKELADSIDKANKAAVNAEKSFTGLTFQMVDFLHVIEDVNAEFDRLKTVDIETDILAPDFGDMERSFKEVTEKAAKDARDAFSANLEDAFVDGFQGAMKNLSDIWKAFTIGLGQVFATALSKAVKGTGLLGGILGAVGGGIIGSVIGWLGGLFGGGKADLGLPTFAEAQAILAQRALEAAEALASIKNVIANTNLSIFRAKLALDGFRDSLHEARKAQREAARAILAVGRGFEILLGREGAIGFGRVVMGAKARKELERRIQEAIGTGKFGFISRREKKEILAAVVGEENEQLALALVEAAAATALLVADFALQKEHLNVLRDTRKVARATRDRLSSIKPILKGGFRDVVRAIEKIPVHQKGIDFVPQTGLAVVHRGEQIIPARGERGAAGIDAGGGRPTSLTAHIYIDGKRIETVIVPIAVAGMEDAIASRETSIRVNTRERRG